MSYADSTLPEFDQEMAVTRKVLERMPEDKWSWRAHPKSNTIGWNANHLAEIPGWAAITLQKTSWDIAADGGGCQSTNGMMTGNATPHAEPQGAECPTTCP